MPRGAAAGDGIGREWTDRCPGILVQILVEAGKNHLSIGQFGDPPQQPSDRRRGGADAGRDDEARWRCFAPARRDPIEQPVAPIRKVDEAQPRQLGRPTRNQDGEEVERFFPMARQPLDQVELRQRIDRHPLHLHLVEHGAERLPQLQRLTGIGCAACILYHARQDHLPPHRRDGGGNGVAFPERIERAADFLAQFRIAQRDQTGQQQAAFGPADKGVADGADRAIAGQQDHALRQADGIVPLLRQYAGDQRVGEGAVRRDGVQRRLGPVTHGRSSTPRWEWPAAYPRRTTAPDGPRHRGVRPRSRGSRRCWSKRHPPADRPAGGARESARR